jgi:hypothetical protein
MPIAAAYKALKAAAKANMRSAATRAAMRDAVAVSLVFTADTAMAPLVSKVPGKVYAMITHEGRTSRPINVGLYRSDLSADALMTTIFSPAEGADPNLLDQCLYTAAMSFPLACDLLGAGNQKSPATFFEIFIAHLAATKFGVNPQTFIDVPTLGEPLRIPTDFIFTLAPNRRVHMPVKISTRERVVQVWAHQRMLDGMLGAGLFKGVLVCLTETNKQKEESVVEVCLPNQWAAYQMYIATMSRIYYLDPPVRYLGLRDVYPHIQVWPLSKFLLEAGDMANAGWG